MCSDSLVTDLTFPSWRLELPKPVAWLDLPRRYEVPSSIDTTEGAFRFTKFRKSNIVGLVHITKVGMCPC